jgi:tetratricopeptide repeat protein
VWKAVPVDEADWEQRVSDAWASVDQRTEAEFLALIEKLAAELPPGRREREAVALALAALAAHLPRYQRSLATYARLLLDAEPRHL